MACRWISVKQIALIVSGALVLHLAIISSRADGERDQIGTDELFTNTYQVPWDFFLSHLSSEGPVDPFAAPADDGGGTSLRRLRSAKDVLESFGVSFGEGAYALSIFKERAAPFLIARNTQSQMELVEAYISGGCNLREKQITVIVEYIEVDAAWLSGWIFDHSLDSDGTPLRVAVQKQLRAKRAMVTDTSVVVARSGQRAKTESVSEYLYPSSGDPPEASNSVALEGKAEAPITANCPTSFVRKNVGIELEVDPVLGADDVTIDINLAPRRTTHGGRTIWPSEEIEAEFRREKPQFAMEAVAVQVTLIDGHYALLGAVDPVEPKLGDSKKSKLLIFVRADVARLPAHAEH